MDTPKFVGEQDGIDLWNLMCQSADPIEQAYVASLNDAAMKYGRVWFTDIVSQRSKKLNNQTIWRLEWNTNKQEWNIALFHIPSGAQQRSPRLPKEQNVDWIEVSVDDIIT